MPKALHVFVLPPAGGKVAVEQVFYGHTEDECQKIFETHADGCEFLGTAIDEDRIGEEIEDIGEDEWPSAADFEYEGTDDETADAPGFRRR